ncbi:MAG TPA: NAD-dependent epimerase/dehydratase family protein [Deltaproteobacteria bacterium]|nr:NAD-dependent epimerase/dehydratase family protein [Deltaproteobacteria bacterium]
MRRMVVLGGGTPLGRRVVDALRRESWVDRVAGIESHHAGRPGDEDLEVIAWTRDHRPLAEYLLKEEIDTVVDCSLVEDRSGRTRRPSGANVISAMYVGAAIADERSPVRSWVVASSSAIYPIGSHAPLLQREDRADARGGDERSASIAEAEDYARSLAERMPDVNVALLRLQELAGGEVRGPLARLLARVVVPRIVGFDPTIQLLHEQDAVSALTWAAEVELAGVFNVASSGVVRMSEAIRVTGHHGLPVLPMPGSPFEGLFDRLGLPFVPPSMNGLLLYGQALDTDKIARAGWHPAFDQLGCLAPLR